MEQTTSTRNTHRGRLAALSGDAGARWCDAEFLADLVAVDHSSPESEAASAARVASLAAAWRQAHPPRQHASPTPGSASGDEAAAAAAAAAAPGCSLRRQVALLFQRSWRQVTRDRATAASRASSQVSSAVVFSSIYWRMGRGQADIQNRLGLLQVAAVGTAMSSLIKTLVGAGLTLVAEMCMGASSEAPRAGSLHARARALSCPSWRRARRARCAALRCAPPGRTPK
jgi:hypothetical protein